MNMCSFRVRHTVVSLRPSAALLLAGVLLLLSPVVIAASTRNYTFIVRMKNVTRLCRTKSIVTVNGKFPGPRIVAREGDGVIVKVVNRVSNNVTIHWHGVRQLRSAWADGPAYITQCPIQSNQSYVYNFTIVGQRGTLFWHAHISWLRVTLYGPIIILPPKGVPYPFPKPDKEVTVMLGQWYNGNTESIITEALFTGAAPNVSDAYTINGLPGFLYNCSKNETYRLKVEAGKTYMLRMVNVALNDELFFTIANHTLTVVETDANYVKPVVTDVLHITPGQSANVLLTTKPTAPNATFLIVVRPYVTGNATYDNSTGSALLEYVTGENHVPISDLEFFRPASLPAVNDTPFVTNFTGELRSLDSAEYPADVPQQVDRSFFFTVGLGEKPCPANQTCLGPYNYKFSSSINNVSFITPATSSILQAYYTSSDNGVYTTDFPSYPLFQFNYTGAMPSPNDSFVSNGTKVVVLPFNTSVELVMQSTNILVSESHPLHIHGHNFFLVGQGFGDFDSVNDPPKYNLVDPDQRNTVLVPVDGWVAVRFLANNPGVWFMHCHLDVHLSWGMVMAWLVLDGDQPDQKLPPPPSDLPQC